MKRIGGFRRKTKHKMSKNIRTKGKVSLVKYFQKFNQGDKVCLIAEPSIQSGMYFPRFYGKAGVIGEKRGSCYVVLIKDGNSDKKLMVHPVHLKRL